ncbi:magnesium-dependent phosphatase-1 [Pilobolus umbonatus]|nr:magnesium-dependent phosphatase-1 [Pilobolus umbonatus]
MPKSTGNPITKYPKMIVFDLDYTLWPDWIDSTSGPPFAYDEQTQSIFNMQGDRLSFYCHIAKVIQMIKSFPGTTIALASRTEEPEWARIAIGLLRIPELDNTSLLEIVDYMEIYPGSKINHFKALSEKSNIDCSEMIFFDDEHRNSEVTKLGVHFVKVDARKGVTVDLFEKALERYSKHSGKKQAKINDFFKA